MTNIPSPCLGCTDRHPGCHGTCEKYQAFKQAVARQNEMIRKAKLGEPIRYGKRPRVRKTKIGE